MTESYETNESRVKSYLGAEATTFQRLQVEGQMKTVQSGIGLERQGWRASQGNSQRRNGREVGILFLAERP